MKNYQTTNNSSSAARLSHPSCITGAENTGDRAKAKPAPAPAPASSAVVGEAPVFQGGPQGIELLIHWMRGVTFSHSGADVAALIGSRLGETPSEIDGGMQGFPGGWRVGPARVFEHPARPEMGVVVDINGTGCEVLGGELLAEIAGELQLRMSRVDVAVDYCDDWFTPESLRTAWTADAVRTRTKVDAAAREGRQWRKSSWTSNARGDLFTMGSRQSSIYGRCYDERTWVCADTGAHTNYTRLELEIKGKLAQTIGLDLVLSVVRPDDFRTRTLGLVRRLVDFLERPPAEHENRARMPLASWWAAFVDGVEKAAVTVQAKLATSVERTYRWLAKQVAPALVIIRETLGDAGFASLFATGEDRLKGKHENAIEKFLKQRASADYESLNRSLAGVF